MVKVIQNMPSANDGEKYKDNNNNITNYLKLNKDCILNLGEKNYENLVEAFIKNAIDRAAAHFSFNSKLSLSQSSSTFPNLSNQSDVYRSEDSEGFHNSKGDIVD